VNTAIGGSNNFGKNWKGKKEIKREITYPVLVNDCVHLACVSPVYASHPSPVFISLLCIHAASSVVHVCVEILGEHPDIRHIEVAGTRREKDMLCHSGGAGKSDMDDSLW
jgi:hypothetical protein